MLLGVLVGGHPKNSEEREIPKPESFVMSKTIPLGSCLQLILKNIQFLSKKMHTPRAPVTSIVGYWGT